MNEIAKFETYQKKLEGICDENELIYRLDKDGYPITLTITPANSSPSQLSMLDDNEDDDLNGSMVFFYKEGGDEKVTYKISENFLISDALITKIKNLFIKLHNYWLRHFYFEVTDKKLLSAPLPGADDEEIELPDDEASDEPVELAEDDIEEEE